MSIDDVDLFENIIDIPHLDASVNAGRYHAVPISDSQCFQLDDPRKVRVQDFYQLARFEGPYVQIFPMEANKFAIIYLTTRSTFEARIAFLYSIFISEFSNKFCWSYYLFSLGKI